MGVGDKSEDLEPYFWNPGSTGEFFIYVGVDQNGDGKCEKESIFISEEERRRLVVWSSGDCKEPFSQITLQMASTNPIIIEKHSEPSRLEPAGERGVRGGNDPQS